MENTMKNLIALSLIAAAASMAGCATNKYACPHPNGVTCMAATDIYKATNNADEVKGIDPSEAKRLAREGKAAGKVASPSPAAEITDAAPASGTTTRSRPSSGVVIEGDTLALTDAPAAQTYAMAAPVPVDSNEPYRIPAKIMRIYVRPWEDEGHDLHMGGFIFTEIEPRRWSVAPSAFHADSRTFELLEAPKTDAAQEANSKGPAVATPPGPPQGVMAPPNHTGKGTNQ